MRPTQSFTSASTNVQSTAMQTTKANKKHRTTVQMSVSIRQIREVQSKKMT